MINENRNNGYEKKLNPLMCYVYKLDDNDEINIIFKTSREVCIAKQQQQQQNIQISLIRTFCNLS